MKLTLNISNTITNIRVVATIVIVLYHCACPYYAWNWGGYLGDIQIDRCVDVFFLHVLSDTMLPTFFMLSGILIYGRTNIFDIHFTDVWKKFDRLCIPLFIITAICAWLKKLGWHDSIDGHLWFIEVLFAYFCLSFSLFKFHPRYHFILGAFMHLVYIISTKKGIQFPWEFDHMLKYYLFFSAGYYVSLYAEIIRKSGLARYGILALLVVCYLLRIQTLYVIMFNLFLIAWVSNQLVSNSLWQNVNKNSFAIYLLHHPLVVYLFYTQFFQNIYAYHAFTAISLMFVVAFSISWCMAEGLHRLGFKYF